MLTQIQRDMLLYVDSTIKETGMAPTVREIASKFEQSSPSNVHRVLSALVQRGFIRRIATNARAIEVLRLPADVELEQSSSMSAIGISRHAPLIGDVSASSTIAALGPTWASFLAAPSVAPGEQFIVTFRTDAHYGWGIYSGDRLVIERCDTAIPGCIALAAIDDKKLMLRRFNLRGETAVLTASSEAYPDVIAARGTYSVLGVLTHLIRQF